MRRFVRHPADIPIEIVSVDDSCRNVSNLHNLSLGGMCCEVQEFFHRGTQIAIHIPLIEPSYEGHGIVVWCHKKNGHFELGIRFAEETEVYKTRMVEQVCQIEKYRKTVQDMEGRELSGEQAAAEWISKYASEFSRHVD